MNSRPLIIFMFSLYISVNEALSLDTLLNQTYSCPFIGFVSSPKAHSIREYLWLRENTELPVKVLDKNDGVDEILCLVSFSPSALKGFKTSYKQTTVVRVLLHHHMHNETMEFDSLTSKDPMDFYSSPLIGIKTLSLSPGELKAFT